MEQQNIEALWQASLQQLHLSNKAVILGVSSDCGGGILRGANWGPLFLRDTLLKYHPHIQAFDLGDILPLIAR